MNRTRFEVNPEYVDLFPRSLDAATVFPELTALGVACDAEAFRTLAAALGEPYKIADSWRRLASRTPEPDPFNVYAVVLWMELCPGRPSGDIAVVELASFAWNESGKALSEEELIREVVSRTIALGRMAYDLRPDAPGEWLRELIDACPGFDVLSWVASLILQLHRTRKRSSALAVCRAWMPLFGDLWRDAPLLVEFPCLCLSGSPLVACCGRWGRG